MRLAKSSRKKFINFIDYYANPTKLRNMKEKKERNPYNNVGISFASEVKILELAKERCAELGIRSFSEYVKQLIKYDLGLPNYIGQYISKRTETRASAIADALKGSVGKGKE